MRKFFAVPTMISFCIAADTYKTTLDSKPELAGRVSIAVLPLPVFTQPAELIKSIING